MAFIDVVEWRTNSNDVFASRFPNSNLSTMTQLIVRESQEAVFFSKGQIIGKFGPGKHVLSTENLPLLRNLYGIPFGGRNPFTAEVWFVNKTAPLTIDWRTTTMRFMDPDYGQMVPLIAQGRYGLKVMDAERFLVQLVGTMQNFTSAELTNHFMGALIAKTNSSIMSFMNTNRIGINGIAGYLDELSRFIRQPMEEFWNGYGFWLTGFYITSVDLDTSTPEGKKIANALADRSAQGIAGYTWQQNQAFQMADNAVNSQSSMGMLGVAMMTGGFSGGGIGQAMMQTPYAQQYPGMEGRMQPGAGGAGGAQHVRAEVFCSNCGRKYSSNSKFCPHCGARYNPCPFCGADNDENASRCVTCGSRLKQGGSAAVGNVCRGCGNPVQPDEAFCSSCGMKL